MANGAPGAPVGNRNAAKAKIWTDAVRRALEKRSRLEQRDILEECAYALIDACLEKDVPALKELGDRLEGKVVQRIEATGEDGDPIKTSITVSFVNASQG